MDKDHWLTLEKDHWLTLDEDQWLMRDEGQWLMLDEDQWLTCPQVSVEPDPRVWVMHEVNMVQHHCASYSLYGTIGSSDLRVFTHGKAGWVGLAWPYGRKIRLR